MVISVIIPTHNRADALEKTLEHLQHQDFRRSWEVIVVNNNCSDNTDEVVARYKKMFPVTLRLLYETKPGPAAARNKGAFAAQGEYLIFIDNDILVQEGFLRKNLAALEKNSGCWIVGSIKQLPEFQKTPFGRFRTRIEGQPGEEVAEIDMITGQCTAMLRSQFVDLGGFDEGFHFASGEDRELAIRARSKGIKILYDPGIEALHNDWAGTTIKDYCRRQRLYSLTEPFFWLKYGNSTPRLKLVKENLPPALQRDGVKLFFWKISKKLLGSSFGSSVIVTVCNGVEKLFPNSSILNAFYKLAIAGSIYRGFNDGIKYYKIEVEKLTRELR